MTKPTHYCQACKKKHSLDNTFSFWKSKQHNGKTIWWCNKGIDCAGCKTVHAKTGITKGLPHPSGKTLWFCSKWFKRHGNGEIDFEQWSPQEVMSGVHLGFDREERFGADTENHDIVHGQQEGEMKQALDELYEEEVLDGRWRE